MIVEVCGISIKQWFSSICGPIGSMIEISSRESRSYDQGCILIRCGRHLARSSVLNLTNPIDTQHSERLAESLRT
ncbi:hypothetical protein TWF970_008573 [Orbilia oligospora]|uniref:Uncharacterized protein n=1 Tax=Orbilia oligospora TaxID=2813651 RepID=A0A7C8REH2_ORBOL|nr:hypothetical protein TWF970_008573 [Orbilia oligospora]